MGVVLAEGLDYKGWDPTGQVYQGRGSSKRCGEPSSMPLQGWDPWEEGVPGCEMGWEPPGILFKPWWGGGLRSGQRPQGPPQLGPKV